MLRCAPSVDPMIALFARDRVAPRRPARRHPTAGYAPDPVVGTVRKARDSRRRHAEPAHHDYPPAQPDEQLADRVTSAGATGLSTTRPVLPYTSACTPRTKPPCGHFTLPASRPGAPTMGSQGCAPSTTPATTRRTSTTPTETTSRPSSTASHRRLIAPLEPGGAATSARGGVGNVVLWSQCTRRGAARCSHRHL
jgi:hypothetical protein